jgi:hypothetical protein
MSPTIKCRNAAISETWIDVGDLMEVFGVQQQISAIGLGLADNDFARLKDRANPHK